MSFYGAANLNPNVPVCDKCMLFKKKDSYKKCPRCGDFETNFLLFDCNSTERYIIKLRSLVYESRLLHKTDMKMEKSIYRKFMIPGDPKEPNERYRPWLEKNVGKQGETWNWNISFSNFDLLEIEFLNSEDALLFDLSFP
jgi:hypothetical protein